MDANNNEKEHASHPRPGEEGVAVAQSNIGDVSSDDCDDDDPYFDLEILGLLKETNGRSCTQHACCGAHLDVGDVVRLVNTTVTINNVPEKAIKFVRIDGGMETCTVGFLSKAVMQSRKVQKNVGKFAKVAVLFNDSDNYYMRRRSKQNYGMAGVVLLSEVPSNG